MVRISWWAARLLDYERGLSASVCYLFSAHLSSINDWTKRSFKKKTSELQSVIPGFCNWPFKDEKSETIFLSNAPRFPKQPCFLESFQVSPLCPSGKNSRQMKMSTEHWWNDNDGGKLKYSEKSPSQSHFVHHKYHMDWPTIQPVIGRHFRQRRNVICFI
jgi:hypothetical protein